MKSIVKEHIKERYADALKFRHACKEFNNAEKISDEDFNFILESARLSPSSFGFEPWKFLILQNKELREKIKPFCNGAQSQLETSSHFVIILARTNVEYNSEYILHIMKNVEKLPSEIIKLKYDFFKNFQKNDFKLFESKRAMEDWSKRQTYIALANMLTCAALLKIDSCPIEGFIPEKVEKILAQEGLLDKSKFKISCMAAFGYRKNEPAFHKTRQNMDEIVQFIN